MAPVRTSVATEFNSGEHAYSTIKPHPPSTRKPCGKSGARNYHRIYINAVVSNSDEMMQQKTLRDGKSSDGIHVESFRKLASSHIAICDVN